MARKRRDSLSKAKGGEDLARPDNGAPDSTDDQGPRWETLDAIESEHTRFLWDDRLAFRSATILQGRKGVGKSLLCGAVAAYITGGPALPGMRKRAPRSVLWVTVEMSYEEGVKPRMLAAGGDVSRIVIPPRDPDSGLRKRLHFPGCFGQVLELCQARDVGLLILDPLSDFASPGYDLMTQAGARAVMTSLTALARAADLAVFANQHLTKRDSGPTLNQGQGHADIVNYARIVLRASQLEGSREYALACVATNLTQVATTLRYMPEDVEGSPRVRWLGESDLSADDLADVMTEAAEKDARADAAALLQLELANGRRPVKEIEKIAEDAGISRGTLRRAKADLGVVSKPVGSIDARQWVWSLPKNAAAKGRKRP